MLYLMKCNEWWHNLCCDKSQFSVFKGSVFTFCYITCKLHFTYLLNFRQILTMRALKCDASKGQLSLEEVAVPEIVNTDDVIIRVAYAGLCGTDLHIMSVGRHTWHEDT